MLHLIKHSSFNNNQLSNCLAVIQTEDALLLIEDGVYASTLEPALNTQAPCKIYALEADLLARGLLKQLTKGIELIDYAGFVKLTEKHRVIQTWE